MVLFLKGSLMNAKLASLRISFLHLLRNLIIIFKTKFVKPYSVYLEVHSLCSRNLNHLGNWLINFAVFCKMIYYVLTTFLVSAVQII